MITLLFCLLDPTFAAWKLETRAPKMLAALPKPPRKPDQTITARDLDDHFVYPCVDEDEIESRAEPPAEDTVLPRVLWTDEYKNEFWICSAAKDFEKIDDGHVFTDQTFVLATKNPRKRFRLLLNEGPLIDRPIEVFAEKGALRVVSFFPLADGKQIPFSQTRIKCDSKGCVPGEETCALDTKGVDAKSEVKKFDAAVKQHVAHPDREPPVDLDRLFLAAVAGDKSAASRIHQYPIELPEEQPAAEQVARYQTELEEAVRIGCGKTQVQRSR